MSQLIMADSDNFFASSLIAALEAVSAAEDDLTSAVAAQSLAALKLSEAQQVRDELKATVNDLLASTEASIDETVEKSDQLRLATELLETAAANLARADEWVKRAKKTHAKAFVKKQAAEDCASY